jgi:hypothetical protein
MQGITKGRETCPFLLGRQKMKIVFHKGVWPWDWAIRVFSMGRFSHCEVIFSDGMWFSSRPGKGTAYKVRKLDDNWEVLDLWVSPEVEAEVRKWCDSENNCPYDWLGVARFVLGFLKPSEERWFCSEICAAIIQKCGYLNYVEPHKLHPVGLYNLCKKRLLL